jgi:hypothetical protein
MANLQAAMRLAELAEILVLRSKCDSKIRQAVRGTGRFNRSNAPVLTQLNFNFWIANPKQNISILRPPMRK